MTPWVPDIAWPFFASLSSLCSVLPLLPLARRFGLRLRPLLSFSLLLLLFSAIDGVWTELEHERITDKIKQAAISDSNKD